MTERGRNRVTRTTDVLAIGPSSMRWDGDALVVDFDERTAILPTRVAGRITLYPYARFDRAFALDATHQHWWQPIAPCARVDAVFEHPSLRWSGLGYLDTNYGEVALEDTFTHWDWSRGTSAAGATAIFYDALRRDGSQLQLSLEALPSGELREVEAPPQHPIRPTGWLMPRTPRVDVGARPKIVRTLEDTPFYSRTMLETTLAGNRVIGMHESLSLDRFRSPIVQWMLPFRMPRTP